MRTILITTLATLVFSGGALADTAYDKQIRRNMIENPENYSFPFVSSNSTSSVASPLAFEDDLPGISYRSSVPVRGIKRWAGPGEDGNQGR